MSPSAENVLAVQPLQQRWQGTHLLVVGGVGAHTRWTATKNLMPFGGTEQFRSCAVVANHRGFQRTRRSAATEAVPVAGASAGGRSAGSTGVAEPGAPGKDAPVRRLLSGAGAVAAITVG